MKMPDQPDPFYDPFLASRIIRDAIVPLDSEDRKNVLVIDDSMFERELPKRCGAAGKAMTTQTTDTCFGFRMLTLGWSDGGTFLPVNSVLLSHENKKNRVNEAAAVDHGL